MACAASVTASSVNAQTRPRAATRPAPRATSPAQAGGGSVGIVDVSFVFKNHARFNAAMEKMKTEVQEYEKTLQARQQALTGERERLKQYKPGSEDYVKAERQLADKVAQLQIDTQLKKKEFLQRESTVYYKVYMEVTQAVREYAEQNRIDLVLRYNGERINPDDRASVLQGVNKAMVYHRSNLDITQNVLDRLNRAATASRAPRRQ